MKPRAYYNENDPFAAEWLRNLMTYDLIMPGDVDTRSIEDVTPSDLIGYDQCHFFAGIGVWSYALRCAGWPDSRSVWTGSCPCQPLSQAGKGLGFADERHLWPSWEHLIRECRPPVIFGEQVASKAADSWADLVQDDVEALGYAFGSVPFPAASVGAPHIRERLYWLADDTEQGRESRRRLAEASDGRDATRVESGRLRNAGKLADDDDSGRVEHAQRDGEPERGIETRSPGSDAGRRSLVGDASREQLRTCGRRQDVGAQSGVQGTDGERQRLRAESRPNGVAVELGDDDDAGLEGRSVPAGRRAGERTPWTASDLVWCRDGKWRPVEPGTFPLVNGAPARVGRLRGYGNAIVAAQAQVFIEESGLL